MEKASSRKFPPELVDIIIDHLYDDKATLLACTLVSRDWLATSRHHLFRTLIVLDRAQSGACGISQFAELLESGSGICGVVRHLHLVGSSTPPFRFHQTELPFWCLVGIVRKLTVLTSLTIRRVSWRRVSEASQAGDLMSQASISLLSLTVIDVDWMTSAQTPMDISLPFPNLRTLRLRGVYWPWPLASCTGDVNCNRLETLHIEETASTRDLLEVILRTDAVHTLKSLSLSLMLKDIPSIGRLLVAVEEGLLDLRLCLQGSYIILQDWGEENSPNHIWMPLHLPSCMSLQSLEVCVPMDDDIGPPMPFWGTWDSVVVILAQVPAYMRRLTLEIELIHDDDEDLLLEQLEHAEWVIAASRLSALEGLETVRVLRARTGRSANLSEEWRDSVRLVEFSDSVKGVFREMLPVLHMTGRLQFR